MYILDVITCHGGIRALTYSLHFCELEQAYETCVKCGMEVELRDHVQRCKYEYTK